MWFKIYPVLMMYTHWLQALSAFNVTYYIIYDAY